VDFLVPVTDDVILPLSAARDQFEGRCQVAMPDPDQLEVVTNKQRTVELAQRLGVPTPATVVVRTVEEARGALGSLGWPLVVKPQVSRLYDQASGVDKFDVTYAPDADTLLGLMSQFEGRCPVLLQEYYAGTGYGVELLMQAGQPLAAFQHKRLHEVPITGGASSFRESVALDPVLYQYSVRLLEALNWTGLAMVEFKVGVDGPRLMEINGRIWGSLPLATLSGMDFPAQLAALYMDAPTAPKAPPDTRYRVGLKARNLEKDLVWIGSVLLGRRRHAFLPVPPRRAALAGILGLFDPRQRSDLWAADDLKPFVAEFPKVVAKLLRKAR
jgi:predicted ATP-grasp superfamily ATP-dependent carboligase